MTLQVRTNATSQAACSLLWQMPNDVNNRPQKQKLMLHFS